MRKPREQAVSGIYHVILRGINKQDVFLHRNDFVEMINSMKEAQIQRAPDGTVLHRNNCTYYAYCILHNHVHILLRERLLNVSDIMKRIQNRFVRIYNFRYERIGHLFQDRFVSEPVDDPEYFYQLIRYIHRNPVKAMEAERPEDYEFSSWHEFLSTNSDTDQCKMGSDPILQPNEYLCDVRNIADRFGWKETVEWVNMDVDDKCMDMDTIGWKVSDATAWDILSEISNTRSVEEFKQLSQDWQYKYICELLSHGVSLLQASRLTSLTYMYLYRKLKIDNLKIS